MKYFGMNITLYMDYKVKKIAVLQKWKHGDIRLFSYLCGLSFLIFSKSLLYEYTESNTVIYRILQFIL